MTGEERIRALIDASSLGTPDAKAMIERTPPEVAREIVARSKEITNMEDDMTMTARMLRFEVPVDDQWHTIRIPYGGIRDIGCRRPDAVEFWAEAWGEGDASWEPRQFRVFGTGQPYDPHAVMFQGTVVAPGGQLVWHLFQKHEPRSI